MSGWLSPRVSAMLDELVLLQVNPGVEEADQGQNREENLEANQAVKVRERRGDGHNRSAHSLLCKQKNSST